MSANAEDWPENRSQLLDEVRAKLTPEEKEEGKRLSRLAHESEENQPAEGESQYYVNTDYGDPEGPFDSERAAQDWIHDQVRHEVQSAMEDHESEKSELPSITNLNEHRGGEFHRLLYDTMIPSFLKKYAKKWGATVGAAEIKGMGEPEVDYEGPTKTADDLRELINGSTKLTTSEANRAREILGEMSAHKLPFKDAVLATYSEAERAGYRGLDDLVERLGGKFIKSPSNQKVHSIDITPEMRKSVMKKGQPIAKAEQPSWQDIALSKLGNQAA